VWVWGEGGRGDAVKFSTVQDPLQLYWH